MRPTALCCTAACLAAVLLVACVDTPTPTPTAEAAVSEYACLGGTSQTVECSATPVITNLDTGKPLYYSALEVVDLAAYPTGSAVTIAYEIRNAAAPVVASALLVEKVTFAYTAPIGGDGSDVPALQCLRKDGLDCSDPKATWQAILPAKVVAKSGQTSAESLKLVVRHVDSVERSGKLCLHFGGTPPDKSQICVEIQAKISP